MTAPIRTDLWCHGCSRHFVALIDFSLDGNHEIKCPHCGHKHYRVIKGGVATADRYDSDQRETHIVPRRAVWRARRQPVTTSSASHFLRDLWLNRDDYG